MIQIKSTETEQIATAVRVFQQQVTGHTPKDIDVVLSTDTVVVTIREALTPAERNLAKSPEGAAKVQEYHRNLFATASTELATEIQRITGRSVLESNIAIDPSTGAVVHAFASGIIVQIFLLTPMEMAPPLHPSQSTPH